MSVLKDMLGETPPASIETRYSLEINSALKESVTIVDGIDQALADITIPYCVASSGSHKKMQTTLGKTGLLERFRGKLHSVSEVDRGKPFPDIFLHAARSMGNVNPDNCLVIEDSPPGVEGAVAAGMVVFGYAELMREERLIASGAHHTFKDMSKLCTEISNFQLQF
jgi:HAD superfamily hydrolase (TIGR01509 family)